MLQTRHIAPYLAYDVCFTNGTKICRIRQLNAFGEFRLTGETHSQDLKHSDYKIILRPKSDIGKEIAPGIIPIAELAKFAGLIGSDSTYSTKDNSLIYQVKKKVFVFTYSGNSFYCNGLNKEGNAFTEKVPVPLQLKLFEMLYKWHFEVGMPAGSWIDINTISQ